MKLRYLWPKGFLENVHDLSRSAQVKLSWLDWYCANGRNARLTCRHFGISPDVFYRWKRRFDPEHLSTLEDRKETRRPHHVRVMTTPLDICQKIYDIRLHDLEKSKYEIQAELKEQGIRVGQSTIQKVINRHTELLNAYGKQKKRAHRMLKIARMKTAKELREKTLGSLVQIDTKYLTILGDRYFLFSAIDCKSRFGFVYVYSTISSLSAKDFVQRVHAYFPFPIAAINTDNGSEYLLHFHQELERMSIPHYFSDPYCPKQNGRVERFHQTVEYEYLHYQDLYPNLDFLRAQCMQFNEKYNQKRYHRALGYKTPAQYVLEYQRRQVYGN